MQFIGNCDRARWVAYFDLLGIRQLLLDGKESWVFDAYWAALDEFRNHGEWAPELQHAWFSDTFLIVAPDDSGESFERLEYMSRLFAGSLLSFHVPLRGAIACGRLYADFDQRVFFGSALVEAYEFGEGQDWIGLLMCPSAIDRISAGVKGTAFQQYYATSEVPWKRRPRSAPTKLFACVLGSWAHSNGQNYLIVKLQQMMSLCTKEEARGKYVRTLQFLEGKRADE